MYGACTVLVRCVFTVSYGANCLLCTYYTKAENTETTYIYGRHCLCPKLNSTGPKLTGVPPYCFVIDILTT